MSGFERGVGDGQERQGQGLAVAAGAGAAGGVDMNSPSTKEMVESLVTMGIGRQEAELVLNFYIKWLQYSHVFHFMEI